MSIARVQNPVRMSNDLLCIVAFQETDLVLRVVDDTTLMNGKVTPPTVFILGLLHPSVIQVAINLSSLASSLIW